MIRKVIILDLDNTLYDWNDAYTISFMSLVNLHHELFSISEKDVIVNFKKYFKKQGTLEILPTLDYMITYPNNHLNETELKILANKSCQFFLDAWKKNISLYEGVYEAIKTLKSNDIKIIAFSDASMFWATYRLRCLKILSAFDKIYAPLDNIKLPDCIINNPQKYRVIDKQRRKPNTSVVEEIIKCYDIDCQNVFMLGDNLNKDIECASNTGINSIWARYGTKHSSNSGKLLRNITPWTKTDTSSLISPDYTIDNFIELIKIVIE